MDARMLARRAHNALSRSIEEDVMHFELVRHGVMTALCVALARAGFAQPTVADRLIALPPIRSAGRAGMRLRRPASIDVVGRSARPDRPVLRCRWQRNSESGRLEARWMTHP